MGEEYKKIVESLFTSYNVKQSDQFNPYKIHKILIADDDVFCNTMLRNMIEEDAKYQVNSFFNGLELCNYYEEQGNYVSVIILDFEMPRRNGLETAMWIRKHECSMQMPRKPIIGLTGHDSEEIKNTCMNAGMDIILSKPIKKVEVLNTLKRLIG